MSVFYHKVEDGRLPAEHTRGVLHWQETTREAVQFRCPCGERLVYVTSPPHSIRFSKDGRLMSLGGSVGYTARKERPENWCHFTIKDGLVEQMHGDSKCPGGDGSVP